MNNNRERWIREVMGSMQGSTRAQPTPELFSTIESQLQKSEVNVISLFRLRMAAAASILLLLLNGLTIRYYLDQDESPIEEITVNQSLVSSYNLYEQ